MRNYILITPSKDEADLLPGLIRTICDQTIKPQLWLIINDGSTDNSKIIIKEAMEKYFWINSIKLENSKRDIYARCAFICKTGIEKAYEICSKKTIQYQLGVIYGISE